jgi:DNA-binding transcriptional MerR regulator
MAKKTARPKPSRARAAPAKPPATEAIPAADPEGVEHADLSGLKKGKLYYRIGEVSQIAGVKPYVLRYWESEFRLMAPQKSRSKQRLYRRRDIDMILLIKKLLYEQRFTIAGARKKLRELGMGRALEEGSLSVETDHRARYRKLRDELSQIRALL